MKKFILTLLALSMLCLTTTVSAKSIRIGTEGAYPPWNNLNSAGELEGAEIDFGNEACKRMAADCEWVTQDWDGIIPALLNGKYDIIIAGMSITEERKQKVNFTNGYMNDGARFWALKDSGLADIAIAGVTKVNMNNAGGKELAAVGQLIAVFEGKTVCVQSSTTHANFASQYMAGGSEVRLYQTVDDHNLDLIAGRCDAVLTDVASAIDFMATDQGSGAALLDQLSRAGLGEMELVEQFERKTLTYLICGITQLLRWLRMALPQKSPKNGLAAICLCKR